MVDSCLKFPRHCNLFQSYRLLISCLGVNEQLYQLREVSMMKLASMMKLRPRPIMVVLVLAIVRAMLVIEAAGSSGGTYDGMQWRQGRKRLRAVTRAQQRWGRQQGWQRWWKQGW